MDEEETKGLIVFKGRINLHQEGSAIIALPYPVPNPAIHIGFDQVDNFTKIGKVYFWEERVYLVPIFYLPQINYANIRSKVAVLRDSKEVPKRYLFYDDKSLSLVDVCINPQGYELKYPRLKRKNPEEVFKNYPPLEARIKEVSEKLKYLKE